MERKTLEVGLVACLGIAFFICLIQPVAASYSTLYLSYDRDNFYTAARKTTGSFGFEGYTYQYEIGSAIQYWSFNYKDTTYSSLGTIRVAGGAKINHPSGSRYLGILKIKTELILYPLYKEWWWWWTQTNQDGEISIWESHIGTVNLQVQAPGDNPLKDILQVVASQLGSILQIPFDPTALVYLAAASKDLHAGPRGGDPVAYIEGTHWWLPYTDCHDNAQLAYDFAYRYLKEGASGYKAYEVGVKVTVDFGYVKDDLRWGTYHNIVASTKAYEERWIVNIYW